MFNRNKQAWYLFEPLIGVTSEMKQVQMVKDLFYCRPSSWGIVRRNRQTGCWKGNEHSSADYDCIKGLDYEGECMRYPVVVAKLIRLRDLRILERWGLLEHPRLHIVHRDPRGTINSRLSYKEVNWNGNHIPRENVTGSVVGRMARDLCQRYLNDTVFGESLSRGYVRVMYEDVCSDPVGSVNRVYQATLGRNAPAEVHTWYKEHMNSGGNSAEHDRMGLSRNATATASRWRTEDGCLI
eukprot:sb/3469116/